MKRTFPWLLLLGLAGCAHAPPAPFECSSPVGDAAWLDLALSAWTQGMAATFGRPVETAPLMIVLGKSCAWAAGQGAEAALGTRPRIVGRLHFRGRPLPFYATPHNGTFRMPSEQDLHPSPFAFTSLDTRKGDAFFAVASSDLWRDAFPRDSPATTASFLQGVALHELVHTQQLPLLHRLNAISVAAPELGDLSDEMLQNQFESDANYSGLMADQKKALIAALREPMLTKRRRMAQDIMSAYRARQSRFFKTKFDTMRELEDSFLTMEGVAVWFSLQERPPEGAGSSAREIAAYYEGRERGSWVQMHGALFAALLDTLGPQWRRDVFAPAWGTLPDELERMTREVN